MGAVSYTHLDVYKRQRKQRSHLLGPVWLRSFGVRFRRYIRYSPDLDHGSVSYTHLLYLLVLFTSNNGARIISIEICSHFISFRTEVIHVFFVSDVYKRQVRMYCCLRVLLPFVIPNYKAARVLRGWQTFSQNCSEENNLLFL